MLNEYATAVILSGKYQCVKQGAELKDRKPLAPISQKVVN
jgi:hypothetical protein